MRRNPFTPAFGSEPLFLAGREKIIEEFLGGLENGLGDPNRCTIIIGPRGSGKTVLLSRIAAEAEKIGWISANVTAIDGMLEGIIEQTIKNGAGFLPPKAKQKLTGLGAFGVSIATTPIQQPVMSWRGQMTEILEILEEQKVGLLITVDEIDASFGEMITLVSSYQHFIRENRNVALLMAGLPGKVLQMFSDRTISFVRRAFQHRLDKVPPEEVKTSMRKTINASKRTISQEALEEVAHFTDGFPFLIQLAGYHIWKQSPDSKEITASDVKVGIKSSEEAMDQMILETTIKELSDMDVTFLKAMAKDEAASRLSDITHRMGITSARAGQYRLRLIKQGVIEPYGRGKVQFALPLLRDYIRKYL